MLLVKDKVENFNPQ